MSIYLNTKKVNYRKLWEKYHGKPIPRDETGRTFDIHHIDGNRNNNTIENLYACPIQEHYDIHYSQRDWGACYMIANKMKLSPELISELARKAAIEKVVDGTHHWLGNNNPSYKKSLNGTHPWLGPKSNAKRVAEGTHNFSGGELQRKRVADGTHNLLGGKLARERVANGTHHLLGKNNPPSRRRVADGTHHLLGNVSCVDKQGRIIQVPKDIYQKQKEVTKDMTLWEFAMINSSEGKKRKLGTV